MALMQITEIPQEMLRRLGEIEELQPIDGGCTADLAYIRTPKGKFVIKRSRGTQFTQWLERENRVLQSLASTSLPVPQSIHFYRPAVTTLPEAWLVMNPIEGFTVSDIFQKVSINARLSLLAEFGAALRIVHSQRNVPGLKRRSAGQWLDYMLRLAEHNLHYFAPDGNPGLLKQLGRNDLPKVEATFIHGDFNLDNVLMNNNRLAGIIDWPGGGYGDPRYDIALALAGDSEIQLTSEEVRAFYTGYGGERISEEEIKYFLNLYEFF